MNVAAPREAVALAQRQQDQASDPLASVFVSASAGSGKTKLLIDRLLRLMLPRATAQGMVPGAEPTRIQCLTFTKAAAAEMAIRLNDTLGRWVTLEDAALERQLHALQAPGGPEGRRAARALFATVLDLPGGMRIGTIHAFCQSLLRRFPLEAEISPHFKLVEEAEARASLQEAVERALLAESQAPDAALPLLAGHVDAGQFRQLVGALHGAAGRLTRAFALLDRGEPVLELVLRRALDVTEHDLDGLMAQAVAVTGEAALADALRIAAEQASGTIAANAREMLAWLAQPPTQRQWAVWTALFLTKDRVPRARKGLCNAKLDKTHPHIADLCLAEAARIVALEEGFKALRLVKLTAALLRLAQPILHRYAEDKAAKGAVEYDDLILRTLALLDEPGAAWVLFKLDGGIDHLLLDEVQDTSGPQWEIAGRLTEEFFAGAGRHDAESPPRTIFAVGDFKQSIYGFQGADPESFHRWRGLFRDRVAQGGRLWREPQLTVSFRSVPPVLQLVDAVFQDPVAARGVAEPGEGAPPPHVSARPDQPGRVEIWPLVSPPDAAELSPWQAPGENESQVSAPQRLADALAGWIAGQIGTRLSDDPGAAPLRAGQILVLVRRRSPFVRALLRALKARGVPVANLMRSGLLDQLAVQDLLALCDVLLLPQDDLTLGCVLTSPLGGLDDAALMALAAGRAPGVSLWEALRQRAGEHADFGVAWNFLNGLFRRVDYITPHVLLSEALGAGGGRARLLARLGPEAAEPVDELLSAALGYEAEHPPSLQGFLHWLRQSGAETRREAEGGGDSVRLMTVHGSKGLQARLVVLPDTAGLPHEGDQRLLWDDGEDGALPLWVPKRDMQSRKLEALRKRLNDTALQEYNRLLYVALTRASDRLLICGWRGKREPDAASWYALCREGFARLGARSAPFALGWEGERLVIGDDDAAAGGVSRQESIAAMPASLPAWAGRAPTWCAALPPAEPALPRPLAPSRPDDVALGPVPQAESPLDRPAQAADRGMARRRGTLVHALLQHLPGMPPETRRDAALRYALRPAMGLDAASARAVVDDVMALLARPALAPLFGPESRAEQPLIGLVGQTVISGRVDRMVVTPDAVLICDFKTGRLPPPGPEAVPVLYLRQMAAYRALLLPLYQRPVRCLLVWTRQPEPMLLPDDLLEAHAPQAGLPVPA